MTLDLLILVLPHLSTTDGSQLFEMCLTKEITESADNAVQKRGYKILAKLIEHSKAAPESQAVLQKLDTLTGGLSSAAKKVMICQSIFIAEINSAIRIALSSLVY